MQEMLAYAQTVAEQKRRSPGDDIASILVQAEVDGDRLTDGEFQWFFLLLVNAGGDTTRNLLASGIQLLFDHPDQRARLHGRPRRPPAHRHRGDAALHVARSCTSAAPSPRTPWCAASRSPPGEKVVVFYGSGNRDEDVFADPDRFDVGRDPNPHMAFGGGGPHLCLGMHVARVEIIAMLRELLTRLPDLEPAGEPERLASNFIAGVRTMPVRSRRALMRRSQVAGATVSTADFDATTVAAGGSASTRGCSWNWHGETSRSSPGRRAASGSPWPSASPRPGCTSSWPTCRTTPWRPPPTRSPPTASRRWRCGPT